MPAPYRTADATVAATNGVVVTPSDTTDLPVTRALYVGTAGDLNVVFVDAHLAVGADATAALAVDVLLQNVPVGVLPVQVVRVMATSTLAADLVALY